MKDSSSWGQLARERGKSLILLELVFLAPVLTFVVTGEPFFQPSSSTVYADTLAFRGWHTDGLTTWDLGRDLGTAVTTPLLIPALASLAASELVLLTGKRDLFRARQALVFAMNAKKVGILEEVRFLFFGPGVELLDLEPPDNREIRDLVEKLHQRGITVSACISNWRHFGLMDQALKHNVFAEPASVLISELVKDGYQVISF